MPASNTKADTFSAPAVISVFSFVTGSVVLVTVVLAFCVVVVWPGVVVVFSLTLTVRLPSTAAWVILHHLR